MGADLDLFGDPIPEGRGGRGRPQHLVTVENRNRVNMLLALGWSNERIAGALRITVPTLRKHYFSELKYRGVARDRLDMRRAEVLWREAEKGNVGAMKEFGRMVERSDMMGMAPRKPQPKEERVGKKEAANIAAHHPDAGSTLGQLMAKRQGLDS